MVAQVRVATGSDHVTTHSPCELLMRAPPTRLAEGAEGCRTAGGGRCADGGDAGSDGACRTAGGVAGGGRGGGSSRGGSGGGSCDGGGGGGTDTPRTRRRPCRRPCCPCRHRHRHRHGERHDGQRHRECHRRQHAGGALRVGRECEPRERAGGEARAVARAGETCGGWLLRQPCAGGRSARPVRCHSPPTPLC